MHSVSLLQVMLDYVGEIVTREFTPTVIMEKFKNMANKVYHSPESFLIQLLLHHTCEALPQERILLGRFSGLRVAET